MPQLSFSQALTANQLGFNPLAGWQYEYLPWPAQILLLVRATDNNERMTLYSGSETIQERSPVQGGGTAGSTPTEFTTAPVSFIESAGGIASSRSSPTSKARRLLASWPARLSFSIRFSMALKTATSKAGTSSASALPVLRLSVRTVDSNYETQSVQTSSRSSKKSQWPREPLRLDSLSSISWV